MDNNFESKDGVNVKYRKIRVENISGRLTLFAALKIMIDSWFR